MALSGRSPIADQPVVAMAGAAASRQDVLLANCMCPRRPGFVPRPRLVAGLEEGLALQALAHQASHGEPAAMAALVEALTLACPQGQVQVFADEGPPMGDLLGRLAAAHRAKQAPARRVPLGCLAGWCRRATASLTCRVPGEVLPRRCQA